MNKTNNQEGFSVVEAFIILVVIAILGGGGWYVWNRQHKDDNSKKNTTSQKSDSKPKSEDKETFTVPSGYKAYTDTANGFSVAYPESWGGLNLQNDQSRGYAGYMLTEALDDIDFKNNTKLEGPFGLVANSKEGFTINPKKYGPIIAPEEKGGKYTWEITDVYSGDPQTQHIGDTYSVSSFKNSNGVTIYNFEWYDEGVTAARWVFEVNGKFVTVILPGVWEPNTTSGDAAMISAKNLETYRDFAKTIANTIKVN